MNVEHLNPVPPSCDTFRRSRERFIPEVPGCYVLTTYSRVILYIGLAKNLRKRMNNHLDSPLKTEETRLGRAILFYWIETSDLNLIERTWLNTHIQHEGALPVLNRIYSPTPT
jgi:excinuclease UvrABC nuclease subunit